MSFIKSAVRMVLGVAGFEIRHTGQGNFRPYVMPVVMGGMTFDFWIADETACKWYVPDGATASAEIQQMRSFIKAGDRILEIGAHHGFFMLYLSRLVGEQGRIVSVEAHPFNAMIAHSQIGLNQANNCKVIHAAASDRPGTVFISNLSNGMIVPSGGIDIMAVTVDQLDAQFGPFTVLKIDVEGYEGVVLDGCRSILRRFPRLMLELHCPNFSRFGVTTEHVIHKIPDSYRGTMIFRSDMRTVREFTSVLPDDIVNLFLSANS